MTKVGFTLSTISRRRSATRVHEQMRGVEY